MTIATSPATKRQPGRHAKLVSLARRLIALQTDDPAVQELQDAAKGILAAKFGNPSLTESQQKGHKTSADAAEAYARLVVPHIEQARLAGATTLGAMVDYLNEREIFSRWGHAWSKGSLAPFLKRIEARKKQDAELS